MKKKNHLIREVKMIEKLVLEGNLEKFKINEEDELLLKTENENSSKIRQQRPLRKQSNLSIESVVMRL